MNWKMWPFWVKGSILFGILFLIRSIQIPLLGLLWYALGTPFIDFYALGLALKIAPGLSPSDAWNIGQFFDSCIGLDAIH